MESASWLDFSSSQVQEWVSMKDYAITRITIGIVFVISIVAGSTRLQADSTGSCGGTSISVPFSDVMGNPFFCQIAEAYFSGLTNGTTATTYTPLANVPREQMAAFVTRTMDQSLNRHSKRAALGQFWNIQTDTNLALTSVGSTPELVKSDGTDLWVANFDSGTVNRVRASDGRLVDAPWTSATSAFGVLAAAGKIFITGDTSPGKLYQIDPTQPAGAVTTLTTNLGLFPQGITFDGQHIWTANGLGSVSIVTLNPLSVSNVGGFNSPRGMIFDGANVWVTDGGDSSLKKLGPTGNVLMSIQVGADPRYPVFDGTNIWVPGGSSSTLTVVRATGGLVGQVLATLTGNGLNVPIQATFDGERILVTNFAGSSVSLWTASDLTAIGTFPTGGATPFGACSDGVNFWITLSSNKLARF